MTFRKVTMGVIRNRKIKKNPLPPRKRKVTAIGYRLTAFWNRLLSLQVPYHGTCSVNTRYSIGVNRRSKVGDKMCFQKYFLYCLQANLQTRRVLTMIDILYIGTFATEVRVLMFFGPIGSDSDQTIYWNTFWSIYYIMLYAINALRYNYYYLLHTFISVRLCITYIKNRSRKEWKN